MSVTLLCFFFQAEDGIRDLTVTGVQTCALPISRLFVCHNPHGSFAPTWSAGLRPPMVSQALGNEEACLNCHRDKRGPFVFRSEERRVGKSVDLGGRRIIKKKKKRSNTGVCK